VEPGAPTRQSDHHPTPNGQNHDQNYTAVVQSHTCHPDEKIQAELSWLRTAYVQAYLTRSPPQLSADWHTRWRPAVLTRIRELIKPDECSPGKHAPPRGTPIDLAAQNGALPRTQLAVPPCWWPFYDRAFHVDLALRRTRATAGELDWSPVPASA